MRHKLSTSINPFLHVRLDHGLALETREELQCKIQQHPTYEHPKKSYSAVSVSIHGGVVTVTVRMTEHVTQFIFRRK